MADNFNLRSFLSENKLTKNAQLLKEEQQVVETFTFGYDLENTQKVQDYLVASYKTSSNQPEILGKQDDVNPDCEIIFEHGGDTLNAVDIFNRAILQDRQFMSLVHNCDGEGHFEEGDEEDYEEEDTFDEAAPSSMQAGFDSVNLEKKKHAEMMRVANKLFPEFGGNLENFKPLSSQQREMVYQNLDPANLKENKLTAKERRLVEMVNNAMGMKKENHLGNTNNDEDDDFDPGHDIEQAQHNIERQYEGEDYGTNAVTGKPLPKPDPIVEDEMVNEKPLPKYENIEKLMQEIDKSTDEAAHKYKMEEMKRIYELLETKVASLEEGENAEHIDQSKVKQMRKDIAALRKAEEKLRKEFERKFTGKEKKEAPKKAGKEAVAESKNTNTMKNFDLKKFLTENRLTTNSRTVVKENSDMGEKMQFFMDFMEQYEAGMPEADILEILQDSYDIPEDVNMQILEKATSELDLAINDIYTAIFESENY